MLDNCFACRGGECITLKPEAASCEGCRFFKTEAKAQADQAHALKLVAAKPEWEQSYLSATYYDGKMPWREGA